MDRELIRLEAKKELARRSFWDYCKLRASDFYKEDRLYLKELCNKLQAFYEGDKKIMVIMYLSILSYLDTEEYVKFKKCM